MLLAIVLAIILLICGVCIGIVIVYDTNRVLAVTHHSSWSFAEYRRELPNLLTLLSGAGLTHAWPADISGISICLFRRRLRRLVRRQTTRPMQLVDNHIGFWVFLQERGSLIDLALYRAMANLAQQLSEASHGVDRQRYLIVVGESHEEERELLVTVRRDFGPRWMTDAQSLFEELKKLEIVFNEHGFHIHEGFVRLHELERACEPILPQAGQ